MKKLHATDNLKDLVSYSCRLAIVLCWNGFGVVSIWRGLWVLQDYYIFPDNLELSAWTSGAISLLMIIMALIIRYPVNSLALNANLWNYTTWPSFLKTMLVNDSFESNLVSESERKAVYFNENKIESSVPNYLIDIQKNALKIPPAIPTNDEDSVQVSASNVSNGHAGIINSVSGEELPLLSDVQKKKKNFSVKIGERLLKKILQIVINLASYVSSLTCSSFLNLMILNAKLAVWVTVKSYYWFIGAAAIAYHRWVWTLWDVYTDGEYFALFIFVSIIVPTLMLLPVTEEFHQLGGCPISQDLFDVADLTVLGRPLVLETKAKKATTHDDESVIVSHDKINDSDVVCPKKKKLQRKKTQVILQDSEC